MFSELPKAIHLTCGKAGIWTQSPVSEFTVLSQFSTCYPPTDHPQTFQNWFRRQRGKQTWGYCAPLLRGKDSQPGKLRRDKESWFISEAHGWKEETPGPGEPRASRQEGFSHVGCHPDPQLCHQVALGSSRHTGPMSTWCTTGCWSILDVESEMVHSLSSSHFSRTSREKLPDREVHLHPLDPGFSAPALVTFWARQCVTLFLCCVWLPCAL